MQLTMEENIDNYSPDDDNATTSPIYLRPCDSKKHKTESTSYYHYCIYCYFISWIVDLTEFTVVGSRTHVKSTAKPTAEATWRNSSMRVVSRELWAPGSSSLRSSLVSFLRVLLLCAAMAMMIMAVISVLQLLMIVTANRSSNWATKFFISHGHELPTALEHSSIAASRSKSDRAQLADDDLHVREISDIQLKRSQRIKIPFTTNNGTLLPVIDDEGTTTSNQEMWLSDKSKGGMSLRLQASFNVNGLLEAVKIAITAMDRLIQSPCQAKNSAAANNSGDAAICGEGVGERDHESMLNSSFGRNLGEMGLQRRDKIVRRNGSENGREGGTGPGKNSIDQEHEVAPGNRHQLSSNHAFRDCTHQVQLGVTFLKLSKEKIESSLVRSMRGKRPPTRAVSSEIAPSAVNDVLHWIAASKSLLHDCADSFVSEIKNAQRRGNRADDSSRDHQGFVRWLNETNAALTSTKGEVHAALKFVSQFHKIIRQNRRQKAGPTSNSSSDKTHKQKGAHESLVDEINSERGRIDLENPSKTMVTGDHGHEKPSWMKKDAWRYLIRLQELWEERATSEDGDEVLSSPSKTGSRRGGAIRGRTLVSWRGVRPSVVVDQHGRGTHRRLSDALKNMRFTGRKKMKVKVVFVTEGVFHEKVVVSCDNLVLIGAGAGRTVITYHASAAQGYSTFNSATFGVEGMNFVAIGIRFENTEKSGRGQAVAMRSTVDKAAFYKCHFEGYQDTLYAHSGRQFFKDCYISGAIDFILGNAAAVLSSCKIVVKYNKYGSSILASSRKHDDDPTGLVVIKSRVVAPESSVARRSYAYLGRPWRSKARMVYIRCFLGTPISRGGWLSWEGNTWGGAPFLAEFNNVGPGSRRARGSWVRPGSIRSHTLVNNFYPEEFLDDKFWIEAMGVPFP